MARTLTVPHRGQYQHIVGRIDWSWALPIAVAALVIYLTVIPIGMMIWSSLQLRGAQGMFSLGNYVRLVTEPVTYQLLGTSVIFAVASAILGTVVGALLAWFVARTDMPGRGFFFLAALAPLIIPGSLSTFAWVLILSPTIGWVNVAGQAIFGPAAPVLNIYSLPGMIFVEGLHLSSLTFLLIVGALRAMDANLEESAFTSGASVFQTVRRITIPLLLPALLSVLLISFVRAIEAFEVPAMIGVPGQVYVLASQIYLSLRRFPIDHGMVGTYATVLFVVSAIGVWLYLRLVAKGTFTTITGKAYRARPMALGAFRPLALVFCAVYVFLLIGLPTLVLIWASLIPFTAVPSVEMLAAVSLSNYFEAFEDHAIIGATRNSLILGVGTAIITVLLTAVISWITVRTKLPGRQFLDILTFLPIAIPGLVLGVALVSLYSAFPVGIYGTLLLVMIAYITRFMPYGMRACSATMVQIHKELEEAAGVSGANWLSTFRLIVLPLMRPGLLAAALYIFIVSTRELSSSVILFGPNSIPLSVIIFELYQNGRYPVVAALGVMMIAVLTALVVVFQRLGGRFNAAH